MQVNDVRIGIQHVIIGDISVEIPMDFIVFSIRFKANPNPTMQDILIHFVEYL